MSLLDPVRAAAHALRAMADVADPCVKLRALTAEQLLKVPVEHHLRMPVDVIYDRAIQIQRCRPTAPTSDELRQWATELEHSSMSVGTKEIL